MNKRIISLIMTALVSLLPIWAQTTQEEFLHRYQLLVNRNGYAGVGVETLLDRWEAAYPDDDSMLTGKFMFYFTKSSSTHVEVHEESKYLGQQPVLSLKDSLGRPVNYFQVYAYDDEIFGKAITYLDRAIQQKPDALDLRHAKITSYIAYEGDSPDLATAELISLIDYHASQHPAWTFDGEPVTDPELFESGVQELCFSLFTIGGANCLEAFKAVSERMLVYEPKNVLFLDNVGSYHLVAHRDYKKALKYYKKVLKIKKDDLTAIQNIILISRNTKDTRLEKKYLQALLQYSENEAEKQSARVRLEAL